VLYTGGPYPLAYHGLGDVFVFIFFGLVAVGGTYWVQGHALPADVWIVAFALGALITAILVVNNLRDIDTDARAGKRTLAVRIGATGTKVEYVLLLLAAFLAPVFGVLHMGWPHATLFTLLVALFVVAPVRAVLAHRQAAELLPALGQTARVVALYGAVLGMTLALG
jgi:1,4-dihydroxy-2-naphthoate octaprenyltransferase